MRKGLTPLVAVMQGTSLTPRSPSFSGGSARSVVFGCDQGLSVQKVMLHSYVEKRWVLLLLEERDIGDPLIGAEDGGGFGGCKAIEGSSSLVTGAATPAEKRPALLH